ncbi:glycerophosphodiester phosphodiesterase [Egbenema bharatensis]|uniref:glycerophosphodiester phosphodiesterase n=1 Tax=Egbenema bharatensis TaxID=3463334 RepID=UPI003A845058
MKSGDRRANPGYQQKPVTNYPTLSGRPPLIIAHRGASGYLPEHTLEAYQRAIELGADFIEPDLVITRDGVLMARHEPNLIETTNVSELPEFADRRRVVEIDGQPVAGFFSHDFTLAEIKQLRARQPRPYRDQSDNDRFQIPTLSEILDLVQQVKAATGRRVGIYPETKHPTYFQQLGLGLEAPLIQTLMEYHFVDPKRVFIQSFEVSNLKDQLVPLMADYRINLPLVQLCDALHLQPYDFVVNQDSRTYADLVHPDGLKDFVSTYASAIGPWKRSIVFTEAIEAIEEQNPLQTNERLTGKVSSIITDAHAAGLAVHAYTFRNEPQFLAVDYHNDPIAEYQQFYHLGIDAVFSDFPDTALQARLWD